VARVPAGYRLPDVDITGETVVGDAGAPGRRLPVWLALLAVALTGATAALTAVWITDAVAPTTTSRAVVTLSQRTEYRTRGHNQASYRVEARAEDGRALRLGTGWSLYREVSYGDPVLVTTSRATGDVVGVRTADTDVNLRLTTLRVLSLGLAGLILASAATWARPIWRVPQPSIAVVVAAGALVLVGLIRLHGPQIAHTQPLSDDIGMQIYGDSKHFPQHTAGTATTVAVGEFTLRVTGALTDQPPAGAAGWLPGFHVLTVPIAATFTGDDSTGYVPLDLIGRGPGRAALVHAADCAGSAGFDGHGTAEHRTITGSVCFAVPADFRPTYLIISRAMPDDTAIHIAAIGR
jgi:hypothetical protein